MSLNKRELLLALAALGAGAALPASAQAQAIDLTAGRAIGEAYRAANPSENFASMRRDLPPEGLNAETIERLKRAVAADFAVGHVFIYEGWRLSRTEGRLFALLAAA